MKLKNILISGIIGLFSGSVLSYVHSFNLTTGIFIAITFAFFYGVMCEESVTSNHVIILRMSKAVMLFLTGGAIYCCVELLFRGWTHESMYIIGGLCFLLIGLINELTNVSIVTQMVLSSIIITILELITGIFVNIIFDLNVWDYSNLPYNFLGQICLLFFNLWFLLSIVGIILDDALRYLIYDEDFPKYKL